jgi:hypothetical protein
MKFLSKLIKAVSQSEAVVDQGIVDEVDGWKEGS